MNVDLAHIKALAKAATPGPWHCDQCSLFIFGPNSEMIASTDDHDDAPSLVIRGAGARLPMDENAAFIAAADPTTVLALIAEVERLRGVELICLGCKPHAGLPDVTRADSDAEAADESECG